MRGCFSFTTLRFFQSLNVKEKPYPNSTRASFFATYTHTHTLSMYCPVLSSSDSPLPPHRLTSLVPPPSLISSTLFPSLSCLPALLPHAHAHAHTQYHSLPALCLLLLSPTHPNKLYKNFKIVIEIYIQFHSLLWLWMMDTYINLLIFVNHLQLDKLSSRKIEGRKGVMASKVHEF